MLKRLFENDWCRRRGAWLIVLAGLALLLPGTASLPLLDRDEPRFSRATVEMMERGDWIVPWFNDDYRFDKPPLTYWWMWAHYTVLGKSELGARLHSVIAAVLVGLIIFRLGGRFYGSVTALWSALAWLACLQVWIHGRLALADMPMILGVCLAQLGTWQLLEREEAPRRWGRGFWILWLGLTLAFYAKGPVGIAVWLLGLLLFRWVYWRRPLPWGRLQLAVGTPLFLLLIAIWGIPALLVTHGGFWEQGMERHVIQRGLEAFNERTNIPLIFYFITVFISLFPWIGRLGRAIGSVRRGWDRPTAFLAGWVTAPFLIFTFYSTQLPHYTLPGFPALVLILMRAAGGSGVKEWSAGARRFFLGYHGFWALLVGGLAATILVLGFPSGIGPVGPALLFALLTLAGYQVLALAYEWRLGWALLLGAAAIMAGTHFTAHFFRTLSPSIPVGRLVAALDPQVRPQGLGYGEPSLVFYGRRSWDFLLRPEGAVDSVSSPTLYLRRGWQIESLLGKDEPLDVIEPARDRREQFAPLEAAHPPVLVYGINFARFQFVELGWVDPLDEPVDSGLTQRP